MATASRAFDRFGRQVQVRHVDCRTDPVDPGDDSETSDAAAAKNTPAIVFREVVLQLGAVLAFVAATEFLLDALHIPA
jgi:hypothetical protein